MKLKFIFTFFFLLKISSYGFGQSEQNVKDSVDYYSEFAYYESLNLGVGYSYSFADPHEKNFHLLSIGLNKTNYGGMHGGGFEYGVGTEIGLNTDKFILAPKMSGILYFQGLAFGLELSTYTDFSNWTLRFTPFFGIGGDKGRLTINPHIILANKDFQPIDKGLVNLTINLSLKKEKTY